MHHQSFSAVFPIILSDDKQQILLHQRQNTGYMDGYWDTAGSGHVDAHETALMATVRECQEELGIGVVTEDLEFVHLSHNVDAQKSYYHLYMLVHRYKGTPTIMESEKMADLRWFFLDQLPVEMISIRRQAVDNWIAGHRYSEHLE